MRVVQWLTNDVASSLRGISWPCCSSRVGRPCWLDWMVHMSLLLLDASWLAILLRHLLQRFLRHGRTMLRAHVQQLQAELQV